MVASQKATLQQFCTEFFLFTFHWKTGTMETCLGNKLVVTEMLPKCDFGCSLLPGKRVN